MFVNTFLQYNTSTHQISTDLRFDFMHRPLSDLFLVLKEHRASTTGALTDRSLVLKFTQLLAF